MNRAQHILISGVLMAPLLAGCSKDVPPPTDPNGQESMVQRRESQTESVVVLPPVTKYSGEGETYRREVRHVRVVTPFGGSPGDTIKGLTAFETKRGTSPAVNLDGIEVSKGGGGSLVGGGTRGGWLAQLWTDWIVPILWGYGIAAALGFVLSFIPATSAVGKAILRILVSPIPIVGSAVEKIVATVQTKAAEAKFTQTVAGVNAYAAAVPGVKPVLYGALMSKQDQATQDAVAEVKKAM